VSVSIQTDPEDHKPGQSQFAPSTIWAARSIGIGSAITWILGGLSVWYYPGGNHFNNYQAGYSFTHNWICDSFSLWGYNGQQNLIGSRLATVAMLVFVWLALFPLWAFLLSTWISSKTSQRFMIGLAFLSAGGLSSLPLSYQLELPIGHDWVVWFAVIPTIATSFWFVLNGWRLKVFPSWLLALAASAVVAMIADLAAWIIRLAVGAEPTLFEPLLMKLAMVLVVASVTSLAFLPKFHIPHNPQRVM